MGKDGGSKKLLVGTLIGLTVLIIGLIIGVVVANIYRGEGVEEIAVEDSDTSHEKLASGAYDESYNIARNIAEIYYSGDQEKALDLYERELSLALSQEKYSLFLNLLSSEVAVLIQNNKCTEALAIYDSMDFSILPEDYQNSIYIGAVNNAKSCNDEAQVKHFEKKYNIVPESEVTDEEKEEIN